MYRTHNCGELRLENKQNTVTLCGWVQKVRDKGAMIWVDLRDRYGITQLIFEDNGKNAELVKLVRELGREFVVQTTGTVIERESKNLKIPTGEIEIFVTDLKILNRAELPPFTIEDNTDGGEEIRMQYRYLDLRRNVLKNNITLRHKIALETRKFLDSKQFMEIETPYLIKSTPEGARDFLVPSRMNQGQFYALPQSPQTFKQILMVAGYDKYFQIVRCFRDEDLRADRQPEFTQIDCEMSFVTQDDILNTFEELTQRLFRELKGGVELGKFPRMTYEHAMKYYGNDKPDIRFEMKFVELNHIAKGKNFVVFDDAELVVGICAENCASYTRKQIDELTDFVKRPQVGAKGLVYIRYEQDGTLKSSADKFFTPEDLKKIADEFNAKPGDLMLILAGETEKAQKALSELRLEMGKRLGLREGNYRPLWVIDFPLLEWDEEGKRFHAKHHPFTSPKVEQFELLETDPGKVIANAYDLVINGVEIGGGSIRIHDEKLQQKAFKALGFTDEEAKKQFGFLMDAFKFGAPPHGGIAFGLDRLCAMFGGTDSIRDYIAFPKNNSGRDMMIDSPSTVADDQLKELNLQLRK